MKKKLISIFLAAAVIAANALAVFAGDTESGSARNIYEATGEYMSGLGVPQVGSVGGEWMVIGLTRAGYGCPDGYYENAADYVEENINDDEQLHRRKSTDNSRVILALTSAGYDVTDVSGHNLLMGLTDMDYVAWQGINGPIWALIAFDSHNYEIPQNENASEQVTRELLIKYILESQLDNGGWVLSGIGSNADPDITGMAIQALAPYYGTNEDVKAAVDKALDCLSGIQDEQGNFASTGFFGGTSNTESCAQVIVALTALGINPETDERFVKNGVSALDALCGFAVDGGGFSHVYGGGLDGMATEQGQYALVSYFRYLEGKTSLYDMSDVIITDEDAANAVEALIADIGTVTGSSGDAVEAARSAYDALSDAQKALVENYAVLTDAETEFSEINKNNSDSQENDEEDETAAPSEDGADKIETAAPNNDSTDKEINQAETAPGEQISPQTGDNSSMELRAILMIVSFIGIIGAGHACRRDKTGRKLAER